MELPFPEPVEALLWQLELVRAGRKGALLVPYWQPGAEGWIAAAADLSWEPTPAGMVAWSPGRFWSVEIRRAAMQGRLGPILGYPGARKPICHTGCATLRNAAGVELWSMVVDAETETRARDILEGLAPAGASVAIEDDKELVYRRILYWKFYYERAMSNEQSDARMG